jgi:hypothetical protein
MFASLSRLGHAPLRPTDVGSNRLSFLRDPLDASDLASQNPEIVQRLAKELEARRRTATAARLKTDADATKGLSQEELERLRVLGYIQ